LQHLGIGVVALALTHQRTVPFEAVGFQAAQNGILGAGHFPWRVEVFHAQQPAAADCAGVKVRGKGGHQGAEVQITAGRGSEAADVGG
jgi:hypothetical protein